MVCPFRLFFDISIVMGLHRPEMKVPCTDVWLSVPLELPFCEGAADWPLTVRPRLLDLPIHNRP